MVVIVVDQSSYSVSSLHSIWTSASASWHQHLHPGGVLGTTSSLLPPQRSYRPPSASRRLNCSSVRLAYYRMLLWFASASDNNFCLTDVRLTCSLSSWANNLTTSYGCVCTLDTIAWVYAPGEDQTHFWAYNNVKHIRESEQQGQEEIKEGELWGKGKEEEGRRRGRRRMRGGGEKEKEEEANKRKMRKD